MSSVTYIHPSFIFDVDNCSFVNKVFHSVHAYDLPQLPNVVVFSLCIRKKERTNIRIITKLQLETDCRHDVCSASVVMLTFDISVMTISAP